jgi:hypothetical protein
MAALWDEFGTSGAAATETSASSAMELTRAWLDAVASTSAVNEVTRFSARSGRRYRASRSTTRDLARHPSLEQSL